MRSPTLLIPTLLVALAATVLPGCFGGTTETEEDTMSSSSSQEFVATPNVSFTGVVGEIEASIYMEGTHVLTLSDRSIVLLTAADRGMDLGRYVGEEVEVRGSARPSVEGNLTHVQVTEVTLLEDAESSESRSSEREGTFCGGIAGIGCPEGEICTDDPSDDCDPNQGGADCGGICVPSAASSSISSIAASVSISSKSSIAAAPSSASSESSESSSVDASDLEAAIELMAKQDYAPALWTQQYCTSHIAFCIPVHKNWYFKSFGATTTSLWHVEFAMESVETLGMGPIVLNLVNGSSASVSASDGAVVTKGSDIIGYKDWDDDTHFEIIADARLRTPVTHMLSRITPYTPAE